MLGLDFNLFYCQMTIFCFMQPFFQELWLCSLFCNHSDCSCLVCILCSILPICLSLWPGLFWMIFWGQIVQQYYFFRKIFQEAYKCAMGFPHSSVGKESACNVGDQGSIPGSGRSPGERNGKPLQYSCLGNPMDRGARQAIVHEVTKSWTRLRDETTIRVLWGLKCIWTLPLAVLFAVTLGRTLSQTVLTSRIPLTVPIPLAFPFLWEALRNSIHLTLKSST